MPTAPPNHRPHAPRSTNRQATRALNTNSKGWKQLRDMVLTRDLYRCRDCGSFADEVDHDDEDSHNNDLGNLVTRCSRCHSAKTMRAENDRRKRERQ